VIQVAFGVAEWKAIAPFGVVAAAGMLVLLYEVFASPRPSSARVMGLAQLGLLAGFATDVWLWGSNQSAFGGTLLYRGELDPRDRELLILRTAANCSADYEWGQHAVIGVDAGLTAEQVRRCADPIEVGEWGDDDAALLRAADELHHDSRIGDTTWSALATRYSEAQLLELCMVVGQYHLVAMTLNSLGVEPETDDFPELPA